MSLTRVSPALFQVSNNITSVTVGGSANTVSLTFDSNGVITGASNNALSVANTQITGNIISSQITSVANTQITGNIISSQITSVANTQITGLIQAAQIGSANATLVTSGTLPAARLPAGSVLQRVNFQTGAVATGTTIIPNDDTIPQITEGTQFMSLAITPTSATSTLEIVVTLFGVESDNSSDSFAVALFKDNAANAIACGSGSNASTPAEPNCLVFTHSQSAASTSTQTFSVRAGNDLAGTFVFNGGTGTGRKFGGVLASSIKITEYAA